MEEAVYHYGVYDRTILFETNQEREKFASDLNGLSKRLDECVGEILDKEKRIKTLTESPEYREYEKKEFDYKIRALNPFYRSMGDPKNK